MEKYELRLLIEEAANGGEGAFATLFDQHYDRLYGYVYRRIYDVQSSEDIVANTFYKVMIGLPSFRYKHDSAFYAWMYRIAYNEIQSLYRENKKVVLAAEWLDLHDDGEAGLSHQERIDLDGAQQELHKAMALLKPVQREVVELYYFANLDHKTIASVIGKREGAVRTILSRALQQLRTSMNDHNTKEVLV